MMAEVYDLYRDVESGASRLQAPLLFGIRLLWGSQFAMAGFGKISNLEGATSAFAGWGFPLPAVHALMAGTTEFFGGLLLMVGLGTRPVGLVLSVVMMIAMGTAHRGELLAASLSDAGPALTALPATYLLAALVALVMGGGPWSLDHVLSARVDPASTLSSEVAS